MKKKICVSGMMFALMVAVFAGCGGENQSTGKSQKVSSEQEDTALLKDMEEINTLASMVDRNRRVFYTLKGIMADGTDVSYTVYQDKNRYVETDGDEILIEENGDVYGMGMEQGIPFRCLFIGDTYAEFAESKTELIYGYDEDEKIILKEVRDGMIYLETELSKEAAEQYYTVYGYTIDEVDYIFSEYEIDSETKEIVELKTYVVSGEKKILYSDVTVDRECEAYTPDEEITDGVFGSNSRTLSVVADAGTADEKTYTQAVTEGSSIILFIPEDFEQTVYADAECTEEVEIDRAKDQTVYLKRVS